MKILTLSLERYGPFSGRMLQFNQSAKLHVVYGPNEAGKSCALAAVTDLLFGVDTRTPFDFLYAGKDLRIGATIIARNGTELTFRRRKGNKNTLISATSEAPLSDDVLSPFVGGITKEVFCNAFGLNAEALRRGADEMLKSDGEVGASLFAAASGLRGLTDLRKQLEAEADGIFAPHKSKDRVFYQALGRFEDARRAVRDQELRAGDWKALNDQIAELELQQQQLDELRAAKKAEWAALARLKRVAPQIRLIDEELKKLEALGILPDVSRGFPAKLSSALSAQTTATDKQQRAGLDLKASVDDCASISVDDALLLRSDEVAALFTEMGATVKAQKDLPHVQRELDDLTAEIANLAVRVGLSDASTIHKTHPTDAAQALVRTLIEERRNIDGKAQSLSEALGQEQDAIAGIEKQLEESKHPSDPAPLQDKFRAMSPVLKKLEGHKEDQNKITALERSLAEAARRLTPSIHSLETLATAKLPNTETLSRFRKTLADIDRSLEREQGRLADATQSVAQAESLVKKATAGRPVPSPAAIAAKREQRDISWHPLRATLFDEPNSLKGPTLASAVSTFEQNTTVADQLADEASNERDRVAQLAAQQHQLSEALKKSDEAKAAEATLQGARQAHLVAWQTIWKDAGITASEPAEMMSWLESVQRLLERREELQILNSSVSSTAREIEAITPAIHQLMQDTGIKPPTPFSVAAAIVLIDSRLREIAETWNQNRDLSIRLTDARKRTAKHLTEKSKNDAALLDWSKRWRPALAPVNLPEAATCEMAVAALDVWRQIPSKLNEQSNRASRVNGMMQDNRAFEASVADLLSLAAPDLQGLVATTAIMTVHNRLGEATSSDALRRDATKRKAAAETAHKAATTAAAEAEAVVARLAAILPEGSKPAELEYPLTQRESILDTLNTLRRQLIAQADGHNEAELRQSLTSFDADTAAAKIVALEEDDRELESKGREAFALHKEALEKRRSHEQGVGAELAAFQRSSAEAELVEASHSWAIRKLATLLIATAVERHRANKQDPLMKRAAQLFALITGGAFQGLDQELDDKDVPHLIGRRATAGTVNVQGMSEGTRDQLYLALRLAYLEEFASRSEPVPFVGDDLCATFDDERTTNALTALAELGGTVQPILFTHHRHVVDLARDRLGTVVDIVEMT